MELKQANTLVALLDDTFKKKVRLVAPSRVWRTRLLTALCDVQYPLKETLKPLSQPTYFTDLIEELDRAPEKTLLTRVWERMAGYIRLK